MNISIPITIVTIIKPTSDTTESPTICNIAANSAPTINRPIPINNSILRVLFFIVEYIILLIEYSKDIGFFRLRRILKKPIEKN